MRETLNVRLKQMICKLFGHKKRYSHHFNNNDFYTCKRCGRFV